jgi:hypothetical protein
MAIKPATKAVANHPAIKPANSMGDIFFIVMDSPGRGWILARTPFSKVAVLKLRESLSRLLFRGALSLESGQHGRVGSSRRGCGCDCGRSKGHVGGAAAAKPAASCATAKSTAAGATAKSTAAGAAAKSAATTATASSSSTATAATAKPAAAAVAPSAASSHSGGE